MELSEGKIILKYFYYNKGISYCNLVKEGLEAYNDQNYILCIENLRKALAFYYIPGTWLFAKIGFAYWNINNISLAIDYLTVATELSKKEDNKYDFTNLIEMLKKQEKKKELKLKN